MTWCIESLNWSSEAPGTRQGSLALWVFVVTCLSKFQPLCMCGITHTHLYTHTQKIHTLHILYKPCDKYNEHVHAYTAHWDLHTHTQAHTPRPPTHTHWKAHLCRWKVDAVNSFALHTTASHLSAQAKQFMSESDTCAFWTYCHASPLTGHTLVSTRTYTDTCTRSSKQCCSNML